MSFFYEFGLCTARGGMLSLANLEAMRAGKYLYAGTLTPRIREKRGGANEESCVSIASERLHARDALSKPGLCNFAICLANARTHAFTQLREVHVLLWYADYHYFSIFYFDNDFYIQFNHCNMSNFFNFLKIRGHFG